jgi:hypothetical protein
MKERVSPITLTPPTPEKQVNIIAPKPKTPVVEKLNKYIKRLNENRTFYNKVRRIANAEMTKVLKTTSLRSKKMTRENWIAPNETVIEKLKSHAPLIYEVLQGMLAKDQQKRTISQCIRTIIAVALRKRNMLVNSFKKTVGLILFKGSATLEVS